jgi:creatinine amidohydrolase
VTQAAHNAEEIHPDVPVRWEDLASPDVSSCLAARPCEVGLLPVGATEQHGPHLPVGTDTVVAGALADLASARTGAPVLPSIAVGCSYGHGTLLPGTLSRSPEELAAEVVSDIEWAAQSGLRRVLAVNGHFGNQAALAVAADHLRHRRPDLRFGIFNWWAAGGELAAEVEADGTDVHANRAETSLMLAVAPELVHLDRLALADDVDRTDGLVFRYTATALSINGVTGSPSLATRELGVRLLSAAVGTLVDLIERGRVEEPPLAGHQPRVGAASPGATAPTEGMAVGAPTEGVGAR